MLKLDSPITLNSSYPSIRLKKSLLIQVASYSNRSPPQTLTLHNAMWLASFN